MAVSYLQLPPDGAGKKARTYDKGAEGHDQYFVFKTDRHDRTTYLAVPPQFTLVTTAHVSTAGFCWIINPVGSAVLIAFDRALFWSQLAANLSRVNSPRITLERFSFTGTPSGTLVTAAKQATSDPAPTGQCRTANTGMTITIGPALYCFMPMVNMGTTASSPRARMPGYTIWTPDSENQIILAAGEGIVCRQPDAGTTSDGRKFNVNFAWQEFTQP